MAPLADLMMPHMPISKLFRSFPAPEDWGGRSLQPDLAAHGVLRKKDAALFVEYDGYYLHGEKAGVLRDEAKNAALLSFAPEGSLVIRISHARKSALKGYVFCINVDTWHQSDRKSFSKTLQIILKKMLHAAGQLFHPDVVRRIQQALQQEKTLVSVKALDFMNEARVRGCGNTTAEISQFLIHCGFSIRDAGLMSIAGLKGMSIAEVLRPRIHWLISLGLTRHQLAKAVDRFPSLLSYSMARNLQPTMQWLMALGLSKGQVANAVGRAPSLLGLSIEQNLKPKVQWLMALGLSKGQVATAIVIKPQLLGYSLEKNLKPKYAFLRRSFGVPGTASLIAKRPTVLGYSMLRVEERMNILARHNMTAKLASYIDLTEARFRKRFSD